MGRGGSFLVTPVIVASLVSLLGSASGARAASITLSGYVADPLNAALIGSDAWAGAVPPSPLFGDDFEIDDNVALHEIVPVTGGMTTFESLGFGLGGIDPYFSLFAGGGAGATFVGSNWDDAFFGDGGDFLLQFNLAPGIYSVAIGTFANMSFAENIGAGVLGDGFIAAGSGFLGSYYYELGVTSSAASVPEPSTLAYLATAVLGLLARRRKLTPPHSKAAAPSKGA